PDLLAGFGVLGGFLLYLVSLDVSGLQRKLALLGAAVATAVGVFSKESAVTVVGAIILFEIIWMKDRRGIQGRLISFLAVLTPVLLMLMQRMKVMAAATSAASFPLLDNPISAAGFGQGRLTAIAVLARYLWRLVCPITLSADYSYNQIPLASGTPS